MKFSVVVKKCFSAAHKLEGHSGRCSKLHGHTWQVEAVFSGRDLRPGGMLIDFDEAEGMLEKAIVDLDHAYLNEVEPFRGLPPTAENVAGTIFDRIRGQMDRAQGSGGCELEEVTVWESPDARASYSR